nr:ectoine/hydroxyectoine ABC transporter permease subunit EhuC [Ensifer sp. WSM1721]
MDALFDQLDQLLPLLTRGAGVTISIAAQSMVVAIALAFVTGMARRSSLRILRQVALVYVELFRGTSLLVQLFVLYFVLPIYGIRLPAEVTAILGLGLNQGAYGSEIVRSAIDNIGTGQIEAARALSLPRIITFWKIILPQAVIIMLPSFGNLAIETVKATALVSLITIPELTFFGKSLIYSTGQTFLVWASVVIAYLTINTPLNLLVLWAERKAGHYREASRGV